MPPYRIADLPPQYCIIFVEVVMRTDCNAAITATVIEILDAFSALEQTLIIKNNFNSLLLQ